MSGSGALERIVLIPRNGLGNRLQAWASAAICAAQWDVPLSILWEPEAAAPAPASELFAPTALHRFVDRAMVDDLLGVPHESVPRYLTAPAGRDVIVLAGHDRGEQVFMPELTELVARTTRSTTLVVIAGGLFHQPSDEDFRRQRSLFYHSVPWREDLLSSAQSQSVQHEPYCGLHIRQTDRSREAPPASVMRHGLRDLADRVQERHLFIAADTQQARSTWADHAAKVGFRPWSVDDTDFNRTSLAGAYSTVIDWLLLSRATALVYPAASTFSAEAAVAIGSPDRSIALTASPGRQRLRTWTAHGRNAVSYPMRRVRARGSS